MFRADGVSSACCDISRCARSIVSRYLRVEALSTRDKQKKSIAPSWLHYRRRWVRTTKVLRSGGRQCRRQYANVDPYRYNEVPFAKRPSTEWLDFAIKAADDAKGSPAALYKTLENHGRPKYYWDAHFTFATTWAFLHFADYDPYLAMLISLAFGHDTDSTAQMVGAYCGAVHGTSAFDSEIARKVEDRLQADYGESVDEWTELLNRWSDSGRIFPNRFYQWNRRNK